jgi:sigma-B regulation protein RsbU (phosphoserine phosphatase)
MNERLDIWDHRTDWKKRLAAIMDTMREMSRQTDPEAMVRAYGARMSALMPSARRISLSRRELEAPFYRITRSTTWTEAVNPWKEKERLPLLASGLLGELIYADDARIIDDLQIAPDDPAADYFADMRSLMAIPMFDQGVALNMVVLMRREPAAFHRDMLPEVVWMSNLFGRAAHNLVLSEEVRQAYQAVDQELKIVGDIQRSLLPVQLPAIPTLELAASYHTSQRAGGDYYDFFPLPENKWGILIADVSGHGTPAAVLMAITHSIAHVFPGPPCPPAHLLNHLNRHLAERYTVWDGKFVTAFYGIYDPAHRQLTYACAGHNPPRLRRGAEGTLFSLDNVQSLPLGIDAGQIYAESTMVLRPGDVLVLYTDGITEAANPAGELFGLNRLDQVLSRCSGSANQLLNEVLTAVDQFTAGHPAADDRTLLVAAIS